MNNIHIVTIGTSNPMSFHEFFFDPRTAGSLYDWAKQGYKPTILLLDQPRERAVVLMEKNPWSDVVSMEMKELEPEKTQLPDGVTIEDVREAIQKVMVGIDDKLDTRIAEALKGYKKK